MNSRQLAQALRSLRLERDKKLRDVGMATKISFSTISRIERGLTSPTIVQLDKLLEYYNVTMADLYHFVVPEPPENYDLSCKIHPDATKRKAHSARVDVNGRIAIKLPPLILDDGYELIIDKDELYQMLTWANSRVMWEKNND